MPAIQFIRYYQSVPGSQISRPGSKDLNGKIMKNNTAKATDIKNMADFAQNAGMGRTVVAQDDPLALGMVDEFE